MNEKIITIYWMNGKLNVPSMNENKNKWINEWMDKWMSEWMNNPAKWNECID